LEPHESSRVLLFCILGNLLVQILFGTIVGAFLEGASENLTTTVSIIGSLMIQGAYLFVYFWFVPHSNLTCRYRYKRKVSPFTIVLSVLAGVLLLAALFLPTLWTDVLLDLTGFSPEGLTFTTPLNIVLGVLVLVISAPIVEELVFRGAVLSGTTRGGVVKGVFLAALAFSLSHMNPAQTFYQFFVGVVCGFIVAFSGSLAAGAVMHAVNNLLALLLQLTPLGTVLEGMVAYLTATPWLAAVATIGALVVFGGLLTGVLYLLYRKREKEPEEDEATSETEQAVEAEPETVVLDPFGDPAATDLDPFGDPVVKPPEPAGRPKPPLTNAEIGVLTKAIQEEHKKRLDRIHFFGALGLSALVWVMVFVASVMAA
jgi:membrane protease YdiL (CAAX protease family)/cbb3-type cytochrome oxidase subunit 3